MKSKEKEIELTQISNIQEMTDEKLAEIIQGGKKELFEELVKRYEERLLRYVRYLTNGSDIANDVVQDTFIKVYINLNSFKTDLKFSSWIYRIAHNETMNKLRKRSFQVFQLDVDIIDRITHSPENIETDLEKKETAKTVNIALDKLPLKYKIPLVLYYIEDKSYEEIGDILKISTGTVGTLINRGKKRLKDILISDGKL